MPDCLIIGGGIIGLLSARLLNEAGLDVQIIDKGEPGRESSWAGGGILSPLYPWRYSDPINRLAAWSQQRYPALLQSLLNETGIDPELEPSGMLFLDQAEDYQDWVVKWGVECQEIDGRKALTELEPNLATEYAQGLLLPDINHVRNPRLLKAMIASLRKRGVKIQANAPAKKLLIEQNRIVGVATPEGDIRADKILVAAGSWSAGLLDDLCGPPPKIQPVKGQMLLYRAEPGVLKHILMNEGYYLIPRRDGRILVGSSMEYTGFDKSTTSQVHDELSAVATGLIPELAKYPIEKHWAGLRPGSPDGIPYIRACPGIEGLFVNAGHFRNGVVMGLAAAQLGADLMLCREPTINPAPYQIETR